MATLTADVTAAATSWNVSALPGSAFLQVDDEIVRVLDERSTESRIRVQRAYAGTTAATHSSGATLTPVYVPSAPGEGGGGVELNTRIISIPLAFDTPDFDVDGFVAATLAAGEVLLEGTLFATEVWDDGGIDVVVGASLTVMSRNLWDIVPLPGTYQQSNCTMTEYQDGTFNNTPQSPVYATSSTTVTVKQPGSAPTTGAALLILTVAVAA